MIESGARIGYRRRPVAGVGSLLQACTAAAVPRAAGNADGRNDFQLDSVRGNRRSYSFFTTP